MNFGLLRGSGQFRAVRAGRVQRFRIAAHGLRGNSRTDFKRCTSHFGVILASNSFSFGRFLVVLGLIHRFKSLQRFSGGNPDHPHHPSCSGVDRWNAFPGQFHAKIFSEARRRVPPTSPRALRPASPPPKLQICHISFLWDCKAKGKLCS